MKHTLFTKTRRHIDHEVTDPNASYGITEPIVVTDAQCKVESGDHSTTNGSDGSVGLLSIKVEVSQGLERMAMETKLYSLFRRLRGTKRWERVPGTEGRQYTVKTARRIFQNDLLAGFFGGEYELMLRPVRPDASPSKVPASKVLCDSCLKHHHDCEGGSCTCACQAFMKGGH